ncbi:hypothetical protein PV05_03465 [Exophiala xenobiotica]|uniref:Uncharacterized protein n=1 Tax=Exophiala xenobiotica TaxID=348802 RepID=A0A0D2D9M4_9EURO|nr:uncharacterized protein PV05_03465 [Exophiala xenobiotica]KIW58977.1 hypothetical protein PV05_03465 [Exophiala xenobiotica]
MHTILTIRTILGTYLGRDGWWIFIAIRKCSAGWKWQTRERRPQREGVQVRLLLCPFVASDGCGCARSKLILGNYDCKAEDSMHIEGAGSGSFRPISQHDTEYLKSIPSQTNTTTV